MIADQVGQGQCDADGPDEAGSHLRPEFGVAALEGEHDAAVPVQGHGHQGINACVDGKVLQEKSLGIQWILLPSMPFIHILFLLYEPHLWRLRPLQPPNIPRPGVKSGIKFGYGKDHVK